MRRLRTICIAIVLTAGWCGCGSDSVWKRQSFAFALPASLPLSTARTNNVSLGHVTISPLFQTSSFTYRTAENTYEQDPYAGFLVAPEHALAGPIRAALRNAGTFGRVIEPGSGLEPSIIVEASINELYGDFRKPNDPVGTMAIHFIVYEANADGPGRVLLDQVCASRTPMTGRTPAALMAAWDADLDKIMQQINSDYAKAHPDDR